MEPQGVKSKIRISPRRGKFATRVFGLLQPGDTAPDFDLPALIGGVKKRFHLADWLGKRNVVLAFYPSNWEPVSTQQMIGYQVERDKLHSHEAELAAISVDSIMNTTAWERDIGPFDFAMCSDFWPHGVASRRYDVFREHEPVAGCSERAVFVIEKSGRISFSKIYSLSEVPDFREILDALAGKIGAR
jgi:peroxiredoxin